MSSRFDHAQRKRVLRALPRPLLEELSGMESPWHADRPNLEAKVLARWNDEIKAEILTYLADHT